MRIGYSIILRQLEQDRSARCGQSIAGPLELAEHSREVTLPAVWQPSPVIRELRRLFGPYELLGKQIRQLKAQVQGLLTESGIPDRTTGQSLVEHPADSAALLDRLDLPESSSFCIRMSLRLLEALSQEKENLQAELLRAGSPLEAAVKRLMGIRGVNALLALAFLAEVGEIAAASPACVSCTPTWGWCQAAAPAGARHAVARSTAKAEPWPARCSPRRCRTVEKSGGATKNRLTFIIVVRRRDAPHGPPGTSAAVCKTTAACRKRRREQPFDRQEEDAGWIGRFEKR